MASTLFTRRSSVFALATLCCLLWGSAYPAIKAGYAMLGVAPSDTATQMLFAGWRFVLAGVVVLIVAAAMRKPIFKLTLPQMRQTVLLGLGQTTLQYVFFYIGLAHATGVKSSIMNATGTFFSVVLAHFLYTNDRLTHRKVLGCVVGFVGVVVVNLGRGGLTLDMTLLGEGFVIGASFMLAVGAIYGKRVSRTLDPMVMTGWQLLIGGVVLVAIGLIGGGHLGAMDFGSGALLLYMALLSAFAFAIWSLLLKHNPVGLLAAFNFLIPVFGVALSSLFLGESVMRWTYGASLVLVCVGIWLVTRPGRPVPAIERPAGP
jgi:drug/metabolite transporter (DMT)-like permease